MSVPFACALLLSASGVALAQRPKPAIDPETKDGLLIEHILQERDPAEKVRYLEQFAAQYPSHNAVAWVYDQLQPAYFEMKEYDQAMRIGALLLAIEPDNMDAAKIALRSADAKKDPDQIIKWADRLWVIAGQSKSAAETKQASDAKQNQDYAEFCLYTAATQSTDLKAQLALLQNLERRNPSTRFVHSFPSEYFRVYRQMGDLEKAAETAERGLKADPGDIDMLLLLAEFHFRKDGPKERQAALTFATQLIDAAGKRQRPEAATEAEWTAKKAQMLGRANYIGGMVSSLNGNFRQADHMLRLAMSNLGDDSQLAALLYHLGMANYRLAETGSDRSRPVDALRFMRRCAAMRSPYQEQAIRNVQGIRAEYNLP